jgi:hypothetical protein
MGQSKKNKAYPLPRMKRTEVLKKADICFSLVTFKLAHGREGSDR